MYPGYEKYWTAIENEPDNVPPVPAAKPDAG